MLFCFLHIWCSYYVCYAVFYIDGVVITYAMLYFYIYGVVITYAMLFFYIDGVVITYAMLFFTQMV
jgi:hypothetical protein